MAWRSGFARSRNHLLGPRPVLANRGTRPSVASRSVSSKRRRSRPLADVPVRTVKASAAASAGNRRNRDRVPLSWGGRIVVGVAVVGLGSLALFRHANSGSDGALGQPVARDRGQATDRSAANPSQPQPIPASTEGEAVLAEWVNRGSDLLAQGEPAEAEVVLARARAQSPDDEDVHYNLGIALARQGKVDEAIREYREALRLFPEYVEAHNNLGNLYLRLGRLDEAAGHLKEAIRILPDYASAWNNLGSVLQRQDLKEEACRHFEKAVALKPDYWEARHNLGTCYLRSGRIPEARAEFARVLQLQPEFEPAKRALGRLENPAAPEPTALP